MAVLAAIIILSPATSYAAEGNRYVTVSGTSIFYTSVRGAEVTYDLEGEHAYTMFRIGADQQVTYRKNLAYAWKTAAGSDDNVPEDKYFSMVLGFKSTSFESYTVSFESQQYVATEDEMTVNNLIFTPAENSSVKVSVSHSDEEDAAATEIGTFSASRITVSFTEYDNTTGTYTVQVSDGSSTAAGEFENVYRPYAKYVSSGDNAVTPLTFSATFAEGAASDAKAEMKLYELNGQSFELYDRDGGTNYTQVIDNQPPVMCFKTTPAYVEYGTKYSFDFVLVDVLASSPRSTSYFYVLTGDQYSATDFDYDSTESAETDSDKLVRPAYTTVTSSSDIKVTRDDKTFVPQEFLDGEEGNKVYGLVKIYYRISDVSGTNAQSDDIFIDWYANEESLVNVGDYKSAGTPVQGGNFLKLIDGKNGVTYATDAEVQAEDPLAAYKAKIVRIKDTYQEKIEAAIAQTEDGKLYAGSDNNFYLPAFDSAVDEYFYPTDLKYSIYYRAKTSGSRTSLASNELTIPLNEPEVTYMFTIYVTDEFNNPMRYPDKNEETGELEWKTIETGDIWEDENADLLPFFTFDVSYKRATCENPENLSLAYVGTSYTGVDFEINGVSGTYTATYQLYTFDRDSAYAELNKGYTYSDFTKEVGSLFENAATRRYFTTIKPASELNENEADYEKMSAYNWNPSSLSFTPQSSADEFYVVRLTLTDNRSANSPTYAYAVVAASMETTPLAGENDWLENNLASVILLSVAGVCLIALIVLIVVKPKDKGDIDEVLDKEDKKKAKRAKKTSADGTSAD